MNTQSELTKLSDRLGHWQQLKQRGEPTPAGRLYLERLAHERQQDGKTKRAQLASKPTCPTCKGSGWLREEIPFGAPGFGQLSRCPDCLDISGQRARLITLANIPPRYRDADAEHLHKNESRRVAFQAIRECINGYGGFVTLWGEKGSGKTHLACAAVNRQINSGREGRYWTMAALLDHLREAYNPKTGVGFSNLFEAICETPLLVLDEVDRFSDTPWAVEKFQQLASARYNSPRLITILVTNADPDAIHDEHLDFLFSRARQYPVCKLEGNYRNVEKESAK